MYITDLMDPDTLYLARDCALQNNVTTHGHKDPNNHPHRESEGHSLDNKCMQTIKTEMNLLDCVPVTHIDMKLPFNMTMAT